MGEDQGEASQCKLSPPGANFLPPREGVREGFAADYIYASRSAQSVIESWNTV